MLNFNELKKNKWEREGSTRMKIVERPEMKRRQRIIAAERERLRDYVDRRQEI